LPPSLKWMNGLRAAIFDKTYRRPDCSANTTRSPHSTHNRKWHWSRCFSTPFTLDSQWARSSSRKLCGNEIERQRHESG
jgi:hypothetical protein